MAKLTSAPARPLTDREVAKLLCGVLGTCASFGTDAETAGRALKWVYQNWRKIRAELPRPLPPTRTEGTEP